MLTCACGDVLKTPDAQLIDAVTPDTPADPMCQSGEMVCGGVCANVMTSDVHCGNCTTQCAPSQSCMAGSCVDRFVDCKAVKMANPSATDGVYSNGTTNTSFYCAYTTNTQYDFRVNSYLQTPAGGYSVVRATDFNDANFVRAFIGIYNADAGFKAVDAFTPNNCCMSVAAGTRYEFGAQILFTGIGTSSYCNTAISPGMFITFGRNGASYGGTLPSNYFTSFPATEATGICSDGNNAAFYVKRSTTN